MKSPFKNKIIQLTNSEKEVLVNYEDIMEIPSLPHPGAFGKIRKNHIHEGIDLYCSEAETVHAMESGVIKNILPFTGTVASSPWWHNTWCILIEGESGVINYGEIKVDNSLTIGQAILEGQVVGQVLTVLKNNKGRPMNMLHLELYEKGIYKPISSWPLNTQKPIHLKDPMILLQKIMNKKLKI